MVLLVIFAYIIIGTIVCTLFGVLCENYSDEKFDKGEMLPFVVFWPVIAIFTIIMMMALVIEKLYNLFYFIFKKF